MVVAKQLDGVNIFVFELPTWREIWQQPLHERDVLLEAQRTESRVIPRRARQDVCDVRRSSRVIYGRRRERAAT